MTDEERIILEFSDDEIALFFALYGRCPHTQHKRRMARIRETHPLFSPGGPCGPIRAPFTGREAELAWSFHREQEQQRSRYALENLLNKPLPARGVA